MLKEWRCRRLRADLVDLADGTLSGAKRLAVEEHVAGCAACVQTLAALRRAPKRLRAAAPVERDEAEWQRQRAAISRAVRELAVPGAAGPPARRTGRIIPTRSGRRRVAAAIAASLVALAGYRLLVEREPVEVAQRVEDLEPETLVALIDMTADPLAPESVPVDVAAFSDEEVQAIDELLGEELG